LPRQGIENTNPISTNDARSALGERPDSRVIPRDRELKVSWKFGVILIVGFLVVFTGIMVPCGVLEHQRLSFSLFSYLYLAGTIIFGGGPVVVPLLRQ
jgi:hypothetical protein